MPMAKRVSKVLVLMCFRLKWTIHDPRDRHESRAATFEGLGRDMNLE